MMADVVWISSDEEDYGDHLSNFNLEQQLAPVVIISDDDGDGDGDGDDEETIIDDEDYVILISDDDDGDGDDERESDKQVSDAFHDNFDCFLQGSKALQDLSIYECVYYLRKHGIRVSGTKEECIQRIEEHKRLIDGHGESLYPISSFSINCTGDACRGDVVLFKQHIKKGLNIVGKRTVTGRILEESYGESDQQHTFSVEVLWSKQFKKLDPLSILLVKGRHLYSLGTFRQPWGNEAERLEVLAEKHCRGDAARLKRKLRQTEFGCNNYKGDVCIGDVVLFNQNKIKRGNITGAKATVAGRIVGENYGASEKQHTFTVEVLWTKGYLKLFPRSTLQVKAWHLYRFGTFRQPWKNERRRSKVLRRKHRRVEAAIHRRTLWKACIASINNKAVNCQKVSHKGPSQSKQSTQTDKQKYAKRLGVAIVKKSTTRKRKALGFQKTELERPAQQTFYSDPTPISNPNQNLTPNPILKPNSTPNPSSNRHSNQNPNSKTTLKPNQNLTLSPNSNQNPSPSPNSNPNQNPTSNPHSSANLNQHMYSDCHLQEASSSATLFNHYDRTSLPHQPAPGFSRNQPHSRFSHDQPHHGFSRDQPHRGFSRDQPHHGFSHDQPHHGFSHDQPHHGFSRDQPHHGFSHDQQHHGFSRDQPHHGFSRNQPPHGFSCNQPPYGFSCNQPPYRFSLHNQPPFGFSLNQPPFGLPFEFSGYVEQWVRNDIFHEPPGHYSMITDRQLVKGDSALH